MNDGADDALASLLQPSRFSTLPSRSPLEKIRKNVRRNMGWCMLICLGYALIVVFFHHWQVQLAMGILLAFSIWGVYHTYQLYKSIPTAVSAEVSLLEELKRHHQSVSNWMKVQQQVALLFYPISALGGFMLGGVVGSGKTVAEFMGKPVVLIAFPVTLVILLPAAYWLGKWMFKYSFGKHLVDLQKNINDLEAEK